MKETRHYMVDGLTQVSPATPFLILFVVAVLAKVDFNWKFAKRFYHDQSLVELNKKLKKLNYGIEPTF